MMANFRAESKDNKFSRKEQEAIDAQVKKKVKQFNDARKKEKADEANRQEAMERLDPRLRVWEYQDDHTRRNIRNLLSTLDQILWPNSGWKGCSLGDLLTARWVKKFYVK